MQTDLENRPAHRVENLVLRCGRFEYVIELEALRSVRFGARFLSRELRAFIRFRTTANPARQSASIAEHMRRTHSL